MGATHPGPSALTPARAGRTVRAARTFCVAQRGRRADLLASLGWGGKGRQKFRRDKENLRDQPTSEKLIERLWLHNICLFKRRGRT